MHTPSLRYLCTALLSATLAVSCGAPASEPSAAEDSLVTGIRLSLSSVGASGTEYRLTRGTFTITGGYDPQTGGVLVRTVQVDEDRPEATLEVPVAPDHYEVKLEDGWVLSARSDIGVFLEVDATLLGENPTYTYVEPLRESLVTFPFSLGRNEIELGIVVDENGMAPGPSGYDGTIIAVAEQTFAIDFLGEGGDCCFPSVAAAREAYPFFDLYYEE